MSQLGIVCSWLKLNIQDDLYLERAVYHTEEVNELRVHSLTTEWLRQTPDGFIYVTSTNKPSSGSVIAATLQLAVFVMEERMWLDPRNGSLYRPDDPVEVAHGKDQEN